MLVLAIASVPLFLLEHRHWLAAAAGWVVVAAFFADLITRVVLVDGSRRSYLVRHWYDVAIVVLSVLPVARPLRALRALQLLRGARAFIAAHKAATTVTRGWKSLHGKALIVSSAALSAVAVLAVYEAEHAAGGSIDSLEDTLWWAAATVTTVGYGDLSPGTTAARAAAVVLMVCGVSLFDRWTADRERVSEVPQERCAPGLRSSGRTPWRESVVPKLRPHAVSKHQGYGRGGGRRRIGNHGTRATSNASGVAAKSRSADGFLY